MDELIKTETEWIDARQAAEILHCTPDNVRKYAQAGAFKHIRKLGTTHQAPWMFDAEEIRAFIKPKPGKQHPKITALILTILLALLALSQVACIPDGCKFYSPTNGTCVVLTADGKTGLSWENLTHPR